MNEDQVKGVGEKVKGKINEGVGKITDDPAQEAKVHWSPRALPSPRRYARAQVLPATRHIQTSRCPYVLL
nr:CsbD family protein [Paraburkholderia sp. BL8N3]